MKKIISLILFSVVMNLSIYGQLALETNASIKKDIQKKVAMLNDYISYMANKNNSMALRKSYKDEALYLFIAEGGSYFYDGIQKNGVIMETTSLYRKNPLRRLMRDYFDGVINYKYSSVEITSSQIFEIEVSDLKPVGDHKYECTACFQQFFIGYRDDKAVYRDRTRKRVRVYITVEETLDDIEYVTRLGDVTAIETKNY